MSDTARIALLTRYGIDTITESSLGPLVAVRLYSSDDQTPHFEFSLDPALAMEIGKKLYDVGSGMKPSQPSRHY